MRSCAPRRAADCARFTESLIKLVPTKWGPPTFEIDGIKMLPTALGSPYADAERKVGLVQPRGKLILDTCGGLGYFAAWCLQGGARQVLSYEKNADVICYDQLSPVLKRRGKLFHYIGAPNKLTSGRDVPSEVLKRLRRAGFAAELSGDRVLAAKK